MCYNAVRRGCVGRAVVDGGSEMADKMKVDVWFDYA